MIPRHTPGLFRHLLAVILFCSSTSFAADDETWKINLKNADIREFVTQVSTITGKSFVVDPRVKGNVTVISSAAMTKASIYEVFLSVLRVHGYAAVPAGNCLLYTSDAADE